MPIVYRKTTDFPRGTLCRLLRDAYSFNPAYAAHFEADWQAFDDFFYDNPSIADKYGFVTVLDGEPIGLVSWDPRNRPDYAIMGHNCIAAACKGRGYGAAQMKEAVSRIRRDGFAKIVVTTNSDLTPAQRTYESAGFHLERRWESGMDFFAETLEYVCPLTEQR